jgi:hypothetical protein
MLLSIITRSESFRLQRKGHGRQAVNHYKSDMRHIRPDMRHIRSDMSDIRPIASYPLTSGSLKNKYRLFVSVFGDEQAEVNNHCSLLTINFSL